MHSGLSLHSLTISELDDAAMARWRDLVRRSCHQNPFLVPEFVLPAWRQLTPDLDHFLLIVENGADGRWLAAGGFSRNQVTRTIPWPHVMTATSLYTFRCGLLVDADRAAEALDVLLGGLSAGPWSQHALEIPGLRLDSTLARELAASAKRLGFSWQTTEPRSVPAVFPEIVTEEYLAEHWSASRRKSLRRSKSRLGGQATIQLHLRTQPDEVAESLETFLRLEHDSWKGDAGTACKSNPNDESFIREMVLGMADQNRILISELLAGEQVVASAINLIAGTGLFAFKIGWDKTCAAASPGVLHEAELMLAARDRLRDYTLFDSCATEDSYLAPIWPERIPVATGILCTAHWSRWGQRFIQTGRQLRRWMRARSPRRASAGPPNQEPKAVQNHDDGASLVPQHG